eukprot:UN03125
MITHRNKSRHNDDDGDSDHKNWCHICKTIITSDISTHWIIHSKRNDTTYQCILCLKSFANRFRLKKHIYCQHSRQLSKPNECTSLTCNITTVPATENRNAILSETQTQTKFYCFVICFLVSVCFLLVLLFSSN